MAIMKENKTSDSIVKEVRDIKERLSKYFNHDIRKILEDARRKQEDSNRKILKPPVKRDA